MNFGKRIETVAKMVPNSNIVVDIGADHGYMSIILMKNNTAKKVLLTDVNSGPIRISKKNIIKHRISSCSVEYRKGSGLDVIQLERELETVVIAGMGGCLIRDILEKNFKKSKQIKTLILQPMNSIEVLKEWLLKNNFNIIDEKLVEDNEKIYLIIKGFFDNTNKNFSISDYYISDLAVKNDTSLSFRYIKQIIKKHDKIINGLKKSKKMEHLIDKYVNINNELRDFLKEINNV